MWGTDWDHTVALGFKLEARQCRNTNFPRKSFSAEEPGVQVQPDQAMQVGRTVAKSHTRLV